MKSVFSFDTATFDPATKTATFVYRIVHEEKEYVFTETLVFPDAPMRSVPNALLSQLLTDMQLALGMSYYKTFCPDTIEGYPPLTHAAAKRWTTVYKKGLGEFLFRNNLSANTVPAFTGTKSTPVVPAVVPQTNTLLVGIGGGKDSIVSLELLRDRACTGFVIETHTENTIAHEVAAIAKVPLLRVQRTLDEQVRSGNVGKYNGHVPVSALYATIGAFVCALYGFDAFVVSNEQSSNYGNTADEQNDVNHQWSKSSEFENLYQTHLRTEVSPSIQYFSLLRPFFEYRIVELFAKHGEAYFDTFSSCNKNFITNKKEAGIRWCGACPKCAFGFALLAAHVPRTRLENIFGKNLFADESLLPLYTDLAGFGTMKPFDCVGTFDEMRAALYTARDTHGDTKVVQALLSRITNGAALVQQARRTTYAPTVPTAFRLYGIESVLIVGHGKEGKVSEQYMRTQYPQCRIGVVDKKDGEDYLEAQEKYDLVVKTPVIPGKLIRRQYTTATQLFFAQVPRTQIIGITGSKGKSTTATLLAHMCKTANVPARLVGNIGEVALESIMQKPLKKGEWCIVELSSYQLADLDVSPHIAAVTALFPEHLDHHGSFEAYAGAKKRIVQYQTPDDFFIAANEALFADWVHEAHSTHVVPAPVASIQNEHLRGAHNARNAAIAHAIGARIGLSENIIHEALHTYKGLPHRLAKVSKVQGITFYDDAISTTPESTIAALQALGTVDTLFLGGTDRGYDFAPLVSVLKKHGVQHIVLFPDSGERIAKEYDLSDFNVLHTRSMDEAVVFALRHTQKGGVCLLSPASPSYSLYEGFAARGDDFIRALHAHTA